MNDLRVSVAENSDAPQITSRIIMRTVGSLRVILNSKIFPEMTIEKPTDKNIRLTAMDEMVSMFANFLAVKSMHVEFFRIKASKCFF